MALLLACCCPVPALAQDDDAQAPTLVEGVTVVAAGLINPRGFIVGSDGRLFVSLAGTGGDRPGTVRVPDGPLRGGVTGSVVVVADGCVSELAGGFPSTIGSTGRTIGVADVAVLGDQLYALVAGGGGAHGNAATPNGVYQILGNGSTVLVADLSAWIRNNPVASPRPLNVDADGLPAAMAAIDGTFWVVESQGSQVLRIGLDGSVARILDLSATRATLADIVPAPIGGAYIASLGPPPYVRGAGKIVHLASTGGLADVWTGLTAASGVAVNPAGVLFAVEMGTKNSIVPPFINPGSGRLVRQTGPDTLETVARQLDAPVAVDFGPDGAVYVAVTADTADREQGAILRIETERERHATIPAGPWEGPTCTNS